VSDRIAVAVVNQQFVEVCYGRARLLRQRVFKLFEAAGAAFGKELSAQVLHAYVAIVWDGARIVSVCFDRVKPLVDETVRRLAIKSFRDDPIAGTRYARAGIVSSAYKRHGKILEAAIFERLRDNNRLSVWSDPTFAVSAAADAL
jgi:hypothetical protein